MAYNDAIINSDDKQKIAALSEQWKAAHQAGNQGGMNEAHEQAELIRKKYGYSGGADGSGFKIVGNNTVLPEAKDQSESINKIYDAQQKAKTDALKAAYDQNMADYDAQAAKIPQTYNEARRQVSTQADISRANLNEQSAGSGINVGAGSQLALSQQNSRNAAMGKVSSAEADAMSALEAQRQKVKTAYQNAVAQAISENDAARAKALYTEAQRVDNSIVNTAVKQLSVDTTLAENERSRLEQQAATLAKYGDFSGYAALGYSQDQIDAMQKVWGAQNPKLYYERTGAYPASYTASNRRTGGIFSSRTSYSFGKTDEERTTEWTILQFTQTLPPVPAGIFTSALSARCAPENRPSSNDSWKRSYCRIFLMITCGSAPATSCRKAAPAGRS